MQKPAGSNRASPAARVKIRLLLLPFGPDKIHSMTPHGTQLSSPTSQIIIPRFPAAYNPYSALLPRKIEVLSKI